MEESKIIIYQTEDGNTRIETRLEGETVWLTQAQLCELFQKSKTTISEHIKNIFSETELEENSVVLCPRGVSGTGPCAVQCLPETQGPVPETLRKHKNSHELVPFWNVSVSAKCTYSTGRKFPGMAFNTKLRADVFRPFRASGCA